MDVLLLDTAEDRGRNRAATLFNAQTGERFDISVEDYGSPRWVWIEGNLYIDLGNSLFADDPPEVKHQIQVSTGHLIRYETAAIFIDGIHTFPSPDGRYLIRVVEEENVPAIATLVNQETGEEVELTDPFNGNYADGIEVAWSPDGQLIGIGRFRRIDDPKARYGIKLESALAVFSWDGTKLAQYNNLDYFSLKWSPILPYRILYPTYELNNESPCILDVMTGDYNCLEKIAQVRDTQQVEIGNYEWSPDGSKVGFIYWGAWGSSNSGFCYIELATNSITCPITRDDLQVDTYLERFGQGGNAYVYLRDYQWSPSGQYIALGVSPGLPTGDDGTLDTLAIADAAGELLWIILDGKIYYNDPWRPLISSQPEE